MNKDNQQQAVQTTVSSPSPILRLPRLDQLGGLSNQQTHPRKGVPYWSCFRSTPFQCKGQRSPMVRGQLLGAVNQKLPQLPTVNYFPIDIH